MKKFLMLAALVAVAFMPAAAKADIVAVGDLVKFSDHAGRFGSAGPFNLTNTSQSNDTWVTFCLEENEYLDFSNLFEVVGISDEAVNGGSGGGSPDKLDPRSAFLYTQFRSGNLSYQDTAALQHAIWYIEQEAGGSSISGTALTYVTNAGLAGWTDIGNVRVLNLNQTTTNYSGYPRAQDVLVLVPDGGATLSLLGGALLGLAALRRRMR